MLRHYELALATGPLTFHPYNPTLFRLHSRCRELDFSCSELACFSCLSPKNHGVVSPSSSLDAETQDKMGMFFTWQVFSKMATCLLLIFSDLDVIFRAG